MRGGGGWRTVFQFFSQVKTREVVCLFQTMLCMLKPTGCSGQISNWPRQFVTSLAVCKKKSKWIFSLVDGFRR